MVGNTDFATFDIHDRVNYSVEKLNAKIDSVNKNIELVLTINISICPLMEY